jgi:23S rRNA (uracil1939-C5)-methyltransferase
VGSSVQELAIDRLGVRGDGVANSTEGPIFVPFALAGETVLANVEGNHGDLTVVLSASPHRIEPCCQYFSRCGGCAVQALRHEPYAAWKRSLVSAALENAGIRTPVAPLLDCHGAGRRRITLHTRNDGRRVRVGFMRARSHELIDIAQCPLLAPDLQPGPEIARAIAEILRDLDRPLDIQITAAANGLDVDLRGCGPLALSDRERLTGVADTLTLARLSNHGSVIAVQRIPYVRMGKADVPVPPGSFLQATAAAEAEMARLVIAIVGNAGRLADLYCGVGTFALRLAETAEVWAFDTHQPALHALAAARRATPHLRAVVAEARDLGRRPLLAADLSRFDALVIDPPRVGAEAQARQIAQAEVPVVAAISCNATTFARDAGILIAGGYALVSVTALDQFRFSPHVEIIGHFVHPGRRRRRRLLG